MASDSGKHDDNAPSDGCGVTYIDERNALLKDVPYTVVRKAWFILSHILLNTGARVAHLGCEDGQLTYAMAALNPAVTFIGVNKSKKAVREASTTYKLENLKFKMGDISGEMFKENSLDAIINSFTLHQVYSNARYNPRIVSDTLHKQFAMLKNDGLMFIQDYTKPSEDEFVLMEMHNRPSTGESLSDMSEADLLVWYSEHAQPKQDPGCGGFFLEELPPRFPHTRLFRLPHKWAYEFIMRKDNRDLWEKNLPFEFTYFTINEFHKELHSLGAQMLYSAPQWNEDYIHDHFEGHFRLMKINGELLGDPATSFISVSRKRPEKASLSVKERRLTQEKIGTLEIKTLRNKINGKVLDIVTRSKEMSEILPYRIDDKGRLYVYLHDGIIRGLSNAIQRNGSNIDGRHWSGHMLEALSVDNIIIQNLGKISAHKTKKFIKAYTGLNTQNNAILETATTYYPDPHYIEERVNTYFVQIKDHDKQLAPKAELLAGYNFREKGTLREFNAQNVTDAIAVGMVPNSRLELQILSLMQHAKVKSENWISKDIPIAVTRVIKEFKITDYTELEDHDEAFYMEVKGSAGQLRTVNSIFVEESQNHGGNKGLTAEPMDFVLHDNKTINTAVILPLTKNIRDVVMAGFTVRHLPVPERMGGKGLTLGVPQYDIPKEIKNMRQLKHYLAEHIGVKPEMIVKLGESYYTYIGITPQRVHPFAVISPPRGFKGVDFFLPLVEYMMESDSMPRSEYAANTKKKYFRSQHVLTVIARGYRLLPDYMRFAARLKARASLAEVNATYIQPDWTLPDSISRAPSDISPKKKQDDDAKKDIKSSSKNKGVDNPSPDKNLRADPKDDDRILDDDIDNDIDEEDPDNNYDPDEPTLEK